MSEKLYRYVSFDSFVRIVQESALFFSNPLKDWEDKYEGYLFRALREISVKSIVDRLSADNRPFEDDIKALKDFSSDSCIFAMSWCKAKDSMVMWNAYNYESKAVMIEINRDDLKELKYSILDDFYVKRKKDDSVKVRDVDYYYDENAINLENEFNKNITFDDEKTKVKISDTFGFFCTKRKCFTYEEEVRAFILKMYCYEEYPHLRRVEIPNVQEFITGVMVHPKAPEYFVDTVKKYCELNGIKFLGRSKLLDLEYN